jgi:hypothetical protein
MATKINVQQCPFAVGDVVRFTPSERTRGHYQNIEGRGLTIGQEATITRIKDDTYLYFIGNVGGWPWNEFTLVRNASAL